MKPTEQQQQILEAAKEGKNIAILARAGAAKTTTCRMLAYELAVPSQLIAFNKDIAEYAKETFPPHVTSQTIHSLAWGAIIGNTKSSFGKRYVFGNIPYEDIIEAGEAYISDLSSNLILLMEIRNFICAFCQSYFYTVEEFALSITSESDQPDLEIVRVAANYWNLVTSKASKFKITPDICLKMYHISKPVIDKKVIYLDEGQDSNPVTLDIFLSQTHAQLIIVGDPLQAIYAWRGAIDAFKAIPTEGENKFEIFNLSVSFRFTQKIANRVNALGELFGEAIDVTGMASEVSADFKPAQIAMIYRKNVSLVMELMELIKQNKKVHTNVNLQDIFSAMWHIQALLSNKAPRYPVESLKFFKNARELLEAAKESIEIGTLMSLYNLLSKDLYGNIDKIKKSNLPIEQAEFVLTTAHKSKGLEFDKVVLNADLFTFMETVRSETDYEDDDFEKYFVEYVLPSAEALAKWYEDNSQEFNLLYVAMTRAKYQLVLPAFMNEYL